MTAYAQRRRSRPLVVRSIETPDGDRCVDIFERADGTFGFEGYRRDIEDLSGWFRIAHFGDQCYVSEHAAFKAASRAFGWLPSDPPKQPSACVRQKIGRDKQ